MNQMDKQLLLNEEDFIYLKWQLNNGIKISEDETREFGIVDYFQYFVVPPKKVISYYNEYFTEEEKKKLLYLEYEYFDFRSYTGKNAKFLVETTKIKQPYTFILNGEYKNNAYGIPVLVPGTGEMYATVEEERIMAIEYMKSHEMPQTEKIYTKVLKTLIEKTLPEDLYEQGQLQMKKTIR